MATDYKRRAAPERQKKRTPCWVWFSAGIMLGVFGCGLAWLKLAPRHQLQVQQVPGLQTPGQHAAPQKPAERQTPKAPPPRFDFYSVLPEMEVVVPEEKPVRTNPPPAKREASKTPSPSKPRESYVVQAGAFSTRADADRLRARLALIGVEAAIQTVTIDNRDKVYRVRSGPYHSRSKLDDVRANLKRNGISSIAIKLQG